MKLIKAQKEYERLEGLWKTADHECHAAFKVWGKSCDKKNKLRMQKDKAYGEWQFLILNIKQKV